MLEICLFKLTRFVYDNASLYPFLDHPGLGCVIYVTVTAKNSAACIRKDLNELSSRSSVPTMIPTVPEAQCALSTVLR